MYGSWLAPVPLGDPGARRRRRRRRATATAALLPPLGAWVAMRRHSSTTSRSTGRVEVEPLAHRPRGRQQPVGLVQVEGVVVMVMWSSSRFVNFVGQGRAVEGALGDGLHPVQPLVALVARLEPGRGVDRRTRARSRRSGRGTGSKHERPVMGLQQQAHVDRAGAVGADGQPVGVRLAASWCPTAGRPRRRLRGLRRRGASPRGVLPRSKGALIRPDIVHRGTSSMVMTSTARRSRPGSGR